MKILTNKTWESIQHELERAQEERDDYKKLYEKSKKTDPTSCSESHYCHCCKNAYKYRSYWGVTEYEKVGCLLNVKCEKFTAK